jgi:hypothetical protein
VNDWHGKPMSHQDSNPTHNDTPGSNHLDSPSQHQDQYYHVDQGVETHTKPPGAKA